MGVLRTSLLATISTLLLACLTLPLCGGESAENVSDVHDIVLTLRPNVRPVKNISSPIVVNVSFNLMTIGYFDTVRQRLQSNAWLSIKWVNEYVTWDPADHAGVNVIEPLPDKVWRPRLTVMNTIRDMVPFGQHYVTIQAYNDGLNVWMAAEQFETSCSVDVTFFPFDSQRCAWQVVPMNEDEASIVLQLQEEDINMATFTPNSEWQLMSSHARKMAQLTSTNQTFSVLVYEVTLRRRPTLLALTVLLPVNILAVVNILVYTIPSEAGEKLSYSMTSLLSYGVFMSFIQSSMPSSTDTLPFVAVLTSCLLVLSAVHVLLCIVSLRLFHRDPDKHPVPPSLQALVVCLEIMLCLDPPVKTNKVFSVFQHDLPSHDIDDVQGDKMRIPGPLKKWSVTRKEKKEAYSDPKEMTWRRVSVSLEKLLFRFFFCFAFVFTVGGWAVLGNNYYNCGLL